MSFSCASWFCGSNVPRGGLTRSRGSRRGSLKVLVHVQNPLTRSVQDGSLAFSVSDAEGPVSFAWFQENGHTSRTLLEGQVGPDSDGKEREHMTGLSEGRYRLAVTDSEGNTQDFRVELGASFEKMAVVDGYEVHDASSGRAFDGEVRAVGRGLEEFEVLGWSNGEFTNGPVLKDVKGGYYSVVSAHRHQDDSDAPATPVHTNCLPAAVGIAKI